MKKSKIAIYQIFTRIFGNKKNNNKVNGTLEENGVGKFNDITDKALQEIRAMGFTHVWYIGVIEHATMTDYTEYGIKKDNPYIVKGIAGSPFAIKDYYDIDPDLAVNVNKRMDEFEDLIKRTHNNGLKAIIDFVPNHVARCYYSDAKPKGVEDFGEKDDNTKAFLPNNNFYYIPNKKLELSKYYFPPIVSDDEYIEYPAKVTGNDCFREKLYLNDWFETVKLNYGVDYLNYMKKYFDPIPDTWLKMRDIILFWLSKGVDGFKCHVIEMMPIEFLEWLIALVKEKYPEVIFIGEIYKQSDYLNYINKAKFDYLYDRVGLYNSIRNVIEGKNNVEKIKESVKITEKYSENMLTFLENHDEQRIASKYFAGDMFAGIPGMLVSTTIHKGAFMIYFGQEVGESADEETGFSGFDGRTTIFDYWGVREHQKWMNYGKFDGGILSVNQKKLRELYTKIIKISLENEVFFNGETKFIKFESNEDGIKNNVIAYLRYNEKTKMLIVVNLSNNKKGKINLKIPIQLLTSKLENIIFIDILFNKYDLEIENNFYNEILEIPLYIEQYGIFVYKIIT